MLRKLTILFGASLVLAGCNAQIKDYVKAVPKKAPPIDAPETFLTNYPQAKVSPGANILTGDQLAGHAAITPTVRLVQGTQVKSRVSFHANRPK